MITYISGYMLHMGVSHSIAGVGDNKVSLQCFLTFFFDFLFLNPASPVLLYLHGARCARVSTVQVLCFCFRNFISFKCKMLVNREGPTCRKGVF